MAWVKADQEAASIKKAVKWMTLSEEVADDSDKTLDFDGDIGVGSMFEVMGIRIEYVATATVGTRLLKARILDSGSDIVRELSIVEDIVAGETRIFEISKGVPQTLGAINYEVLPESFIFGTGQSLQIIDSSATDAAADDVVIHVSGMVS